MHAYLVSLNASACHIGINKKILVMFDLTLKKIKLTQHHAAQMPHGFLRILRLDEALQTKTFKPSNSRGFTLLEMLVVIALLGVVMLTTTTFIVDTGEIELEARQKENESRWQQIRTAIIGDANRFVNQEPLINGYVADMGRLPVNIAELIERNAQPVWASLELSAVAPGLAGSLGGGWRGPYLYTAGSQFYRDAWGNEDANSAVDAANFGWNVTVSGVSDMAIQSLGKDGSPGGAEFNADFPVTSLNIVNSNEWQKSFTSVPFKVEFNKPPIADQANLELRIYFFEDTAIEEEISSEFSVSVSGVTAHTVNIPATPIATTLPMAKYAAAVMCNQGTPSALDDIVYDGDCNAGNSKPPYYFTMLPSTPLPITIPWNIP